MRGLLGSVLWPSTYLNLISAEVAEDTTVAASFRPHTRRHRDCRRVRGVVILLPPQFILDLAACVAERLHFFVSLPLANHELSV